MAKKKRYGYYENKNVVYIKDKLNPSNFFIIRCNNSSAVEFVKRATRIINAEEVEGKRQIEKVKEEV